MKQLLICILIGQLCFLSFLGGRTWQIRRKMKASDICIQKTLNQQDMSRYFGHKVEVHTLYPHAEGYISMRYHFCMIREE